MLIFAARSLDWCLGRGHYTAVTEKDIDEFRRAMQDARPLQAEERVPHEKPKPKPRATFSRAGEQRVLAESLEDDIDTIEHGYGAALRFNRQHVGKRTMRKLQRGGYSVQAEIDLHGMTLADAHPALIGFVSDAWDRGLRLVLVITGKGSLRDEGLSFYDEDARN